MNKFFLIAISTVSTLLVLMILVQNQGTNLGGIFGADGSIHHAKRGFERVLFIGTILLIASLIGLLILALVY